MTKTRGLLISFGSGRGLVSLESLRLNYFWGSVQEYQRKKGLLRKGKALPMLLLSTIPRTTQKLRYDLKRECLRTRDYFTLCKNEASEQQISYFMKKSSYRGAVRPGKSFLHCWTKGNRAGLLLQPRQARVSCTKQNSLFFRQR